MSFQINTSSSNGSAQNHSEVAHQNNSQISKYSALGISIICLLGLAFALNALFSSTEQTLIQFSWSLPFASFHLGIDKLSAFFLIPVFLLGAICAIYSSEYLHRVKTRAKLISYWVFFSFLLLGMLLTLTARNALLFLMAWELMAISSFLLVMFEDNHREVRQAGWIYIIASQAGVAFLLALFALMGTKTGSLEFDALKNFAQHSPLLGSLCFLLALVGFGVKAGFMPFHVWLPDAHPAAPSPVSALMSGVMIKTGIYGLLRIITFLGTPQLWWAFVLIAIGLVSGLLGVLYALSQRDIKRLLAYSSIENIGIISMAIGLGLVGVHFNLPALATLGFMGALLHVLNHAFFKALLFLSAGALVHSAGSRDMDLLGGLAKKMPNTAALFAIAALAVCGLPPLNGFVSEFLIYMAATQGVLSHNTWVAIPALCVIAALALIGGLAAFCFVKVFGCVFLGEPRGKSASGAIEVGSAMRWPMLVLAGICLLLGILAPLSYALSQEVAIDLALNTAHRAMPPLADIARISLLFTLLAIFFLAFSAALIALRRRLLKGKDIAQSCTWDCGYSKPTSRMQYGASSFVQPATSLFKGLLPTKCEFEAAQGLFPESGYYRAEYRDAFRDFIFEPIFSVIHWILLRLRWLQHGHLHIYVLYIAIAVLALVLFAL